MTPSFPSSVHSQIDDILHDSVEQFIQHRNQGLPRVAVLATSSQEPLVSSVAGYERITDDLSTAPRLTQDSLFPLWSSTKLIATIAALQLFERGVFQLDSDASQFVPELKDLKVLKGFNEDDDEPILVDKERPVTIEMLITHTAGFKYGYDPIHAKMQKKLGVTGTYGIYESDATRESLTRCPLLFQPGTAFAYGTSNDWLAVVVAGASGKTFGQYVQENIFEPLGISDMTFTNPTSRISVATAPPKEETDKDEKAYTFDERGHQFPQSIDWGGAGLTGSPRSYLKIIKTLLPNSPNRLLRPETIELMFTPRLNDPEVLKSFIPFVEEGNDPWSHSLKRQFEGVNYGLGGTLCGRGIPSGRTKGSLTWSGAANSFWVVDREKDLAFIVWTCLIPHSHRAIMDLWRKVEPKLYEGIKEVQQQQQE